MRTRETCSTARLYIRRLMVSSMAGAPSAALLARRAEWPIAVVAAAAASSAAGGDAAAATRTSVMTSVVPASAFAACVYRRISPSAAAADFQRYLLTGFVSTNAQTASFADSLLPPPGRLCLCLCMFVCLSVSGIT